MKGLLSGGVLPITLTILRQCRTLFAMQTIIESPVYLSDAKALGLKDAARTVRALD